MTPKFWPMTLPQYPTPDLADGIENVRRSFPSDAGPGISRPKITTAMRPYRLEFYLEEDQIDDFDGFYEDALAQGTKQFIWRDPISDDPYWWKFPVDQGRTFSRRFVTKKQAFVSFVLLRLTAPVWFSDYIPAGVSRVPYFVADYGSGGASGSGTPVYGIDGETVPASELPSIAGTYFVERHTTTAITRQVETLVAGDVPATAPADTNKIIGFEV